MARNKIRIYWLLLLVLLYTASFVLSIGQTQARYQSTAVRNTLLESETPGLSSNCLVTTEDANLTVLLGEIPMLQTTKVTYWLKSSGANASGKLAWGLANADHAKYLEVTMQSGVDVIKPNDQIDLLADVYMDITMNLKPTEHARTTAHDMLKINVLVTWGEEMWGTFQVILPEVKGEEEATEPIKGEDPETVEVTASTEPKVNATKTAESNKLAYKMMSAQTQETEETKETEPSATGETTPETTEETTPETTEETTPETTEETTPETTEATEPNATEETTPETTEATTPPETEPEEKETIQLKTVTSFDAAGKLPVSISLTSDVTSIRLGLQTTDEQGIVYFEPLPDRTKFSLDDGNRYYMMYNGYIAEFSVGGVTSLPMILDFSHTELSTEEPLLLTMEAYSGETLLQTCQVETTPNASEAFRTVSHPRSGVATASEEEQTSSWGSQILNQSNALEFAFPKEWQDADLEYSVELLTMTPEQTLAYEKLALPSKALSVFYTSDEISHNLVIRTGSTLPQAGTYRVNMKWSYEGICYAHMQTTFFINYSVYTDYSLGSQEVPNDD